ncbi:MAG: WD40/YVTN/BNR-like repeat-containing protein [Gemmatimonadales bacterium]
MSTQHCRALAAVLFLVLPAGLAAQTGYDPALFQGLRYRLVGPSRGGRVTAVAGAPQQPGTFYLGATGGGVWKTTDYGQSWANVSDGFFQTASIGAIRVADADPNVLYVGTGSDGIRSNVIAGRGVYKSADAGKTWTFLGLRDVGQIGAVLIHPTNPDIAYVAAMGHAFGPSRARGVYRTRDGGKTWEQVLFVSDSTGAVDLEFAPDEPREIYAALWRGERKPWTIISGAREGGLYRSADGGDTWTKLTGGLPSGLIGKSDLAVSAADPNRVYALIEAPEPEDGLYRSDDRGRSWRQVSSYNPLLNRPFYYTNVDAEPTNADVVYVNDEGFFRSADGGKTWERRSTPHGDNHDMWIDRRDPNVFIQSNDGGANVTRDGGRTWSTQHNQPTAELYQVAVDDQFPYWVYAGQQDNSTIMVPSLPPFPHPAGPTGYWREIGGCETGPAVPKPGDPTIVYANCKGRFGRYSHATGQEQQFYVGAVNLYGHNPKDLPYRFQRVSPIEVSPHDPDVVYHGSQFLHRTTDGGATWETISPDLTAFEPDKQVVPGTPITRDITGEEYYSTLYAVEESPLERGLIWTGANDGPVHVTRDGGKTWTRVTPPPRDLPPGGRVQSIEPSPHRAGKAYVAVYRYLLSDWKPYIFRTTDYGRRWTLLTTGTNGIPADYPTRVVREDPSREGLLYAGTEFGLFVSFDDGARWQAFQQNLPVTPVTDIKVHRKDLVLSTMGRSFWILDDVTPLHELASAVAAAPAYLFPPRDAYRLRYDAGRERGTDPEYPPPGAVIHYFLGAEPAGDIRLEILDVAGAVIRVFSSAAARDTTPAAAGTPRLAKGRGLHRFRWFLRHPGPWHADSLRTGLGGPVVAPGEYQVRLTVGDSRVTRRFRVLPDPRVERDGVTPSDFAAQVALSLQIRDALSDARRTVARIRAVKDEAVKRRLAGAEAALVTATGQSYPQPMLVAQLEYLYAMLDVADQKPGRDAARRFEELRGRLGERLAEVRRILGEDRAGGTDAP